MSHLPIPSDATIYLASDVADLMSRAGATMRTAQAVRAAVAQGRLYPDLVSPRGVRAWSAQALLDDLQRQARVQRFRHLVGSGLRRPLRLPEPVQLVIEEG